MPIHVKATVNEDGKLIADLPADSGLSAGDEVEVTIHTAVPEPASDEDVTWTEAEIADIMSRLNSTPMTGKDAYESGLLDDVIGSWADMGIDDPVEWLEEQRRKRRKRFEW